MGDPHFAVRNDGTGYRNEIAGACAQPQAAVDRMVTAELTDRLFANRKVVGAKMGRAISTDSKASLCSTHFPANAFASDLIAINIQRGRDHGIPGYNSARSLAGLPRVASMDSRPPEIKETDWNLLHQLFTRPDDIDLYSGGLAENRGTDGKTSRSNGSSSSFLLPVYLAHIPT